MTVHYNIQPKITDHNMKQKITDHYNIITNVCIITCNHISKICGGCATAISATIYKDKKYILQYIRNVV